MSSQRTSSNLGIAPRNVGVAVLANPAADTVYADRAAAHVLPPAGLVRACREIAAWVGYAPTPLLDLPGLAARCGVGSLWLKDEGPRFGLGSFKALGGAYAVARVVSGGDVSLTVCSATDGNHGRSVAWGARRAGCRCVIYLHEGVSVERERAIRAHGAEIVRTPGNYDDSARRCYEDAVRNGWVVVSDTAASEDAGLAPVVMQGYGVMVDEALEQLGVAWPTHVIVQAGCGGLAAAVRAHLATLRGERQTPFFVVVEPTAADCLFRSAEAGHRVDVRGELDTIMAGLAVGEVSAPAWEILATGADAFLTLPDAAALETMRALADPTSGDRPVVAGETGAAGVGALLASVDDAAVREQLRLDGDSQVLVFNTEADTDPEIYRTVVGRPAAAVVGAATRDAKETTT